MSGRRGFTVALHRLLAARGRRRDSMSTFALELASRCVMGMHLPHSHDRANSIPLNSRISFELTSFLCATRLMQWAHPSHWLDSSKENCEKPSNPHVYTWCPRAKAPHKPEPVAALPTLSLVRGACCTWPQTRLDVYACADTCVTVRWCLDLSYALNPNQRCV